jgi:peroxiredoxin
MTNVECRMTNRKSSFVNRKSSLVIALLVPMLLLASGFATDGDTSVLALAQDSVRKDFRDALTDAGTNWRELATAVERADAPYRPEAVWLICQMPHLDRLEMTSPIMLEHLVYAHKATTAFRYPVPESLFRDYILTYRIADEPVTAWRKLLFDRFAPMTRNVLSPEQAARIVNQWLSRSLKLDEKGFFGPMQSPELTLSSRRGTPEEIAVLATAILKTLGVPSRRVKVPWLGGQDGDASWVEVFSQGRWLPLYPLQASAFGNASWTERKYGRNVTIAVATSAFDQQLVTEHYTGSGIVKLHLTAAGSPLSKFESFSFNVFNSGAWRQLDELNTVSDSLGNYECVLGDGNYLVTCGMRDPKGNPWIMNREITMNSGDTIRLDLDLTPPMTRLPYPVLDAPMLEHDFPNLQGGVSSPSEVKGKTGLVFFFNPDDSLAARVALMAESLYQAFKDKGFTVLGIGLGDADRVRQFRDAHKLSFDVVFAFDAGLSPQPSSIAPLLGLPYVLPMPVLKLLDKEGKVVLTETEPDAARLAALRNAITDLLK